MILLWGPADDTPLAAVRAALERRAAPVRFLDQARHPYTAVDLEVADEVHAVVRMGDERWDLADVSSVYLRCHDGQTVVATDLPERAAAVAHVEEINDALAAWCDLTAALVVNPLEAMGSNGSKPYQSAFVREAGFAVPDTLVTNDPDAVRQFWEAHGEVVYKSTSGVRSIVTRLSHDDVDRLDDVRWCPTQFQRYVPGCDYRVHTVGDDAFCCEVASAADDYRYAARDGLATDIAACHLPGDIVARCHRLAARLDLAIAGIDLRRSPEGEWYCFEVNPSPAFTYYESATRLPIADAVAGLLVRGRR
jgi:hypothetical protein